jgi:hypothetical protein
MIGGQLAIAEQKGNQKNNGSSNDKERMLLKGERERGF